jgi:hypothetical protein
MIDIQVIGIGQGSDLYIEKVIFRVISHLLISWVLDLVIMYQGDTPRLGKTHVKIGIIRDQTYHRIPMSNCAFSHIHTSRKMLLQILSLSHLT